MYMCIYIYIYIEREFSAGTPDRAMLTADGQIPSCSRTRHLRGCPGSRSPGPQNRLFICAWPHRG